LALAMRWAEGVHKGEEAGMLHSRSNWRCNDGQKKLPDQ
jgi:hypothetical protein